MVRTRESCNMSFESCGRLSSIFILIHFSGVEVIFKTHHNHRCNGASSHKPGNYKQNWKGENSNNSNNPAEQAQAPVQRQAPPPPDPEAHLPRFLRTPKNSFNEKYEPPITAGEGYQVGPNPNANQSGNGGGAPVQKGGGDDF